MMQIVQMTRKIIRAFMRRLAQTLNTLSGGKLHPDVVTLVGLFMHVPVAILIAVRMNWWAAALLIIFGLFDTLDGELARLQKRAGPRGMLLDSATDRMKEILLYTGAAYAIIASTGRPYLAVWAVAACGCSLLTSYINAWGDAIMLRYHAGGSHNANAAFRGGLLPFELRMFVLMLALISDRLALGIIVITLGAAYTALSRMFRIVNALRESNVQS